MTLHIFDTDILTLFQDGHIVVCERVSRVPADTLAMTVLSVEEQMSGWYTELRKAKSSKRLAWAYRRLAENVRFLSRLKIVDFDEPAIGRYEELKRLRLSVGRSDLQIAATVLEAGGILVTRNVRDFQRVPGLVIEDWTV
jgi:tRNA(fMet)-specific endonuclease VapC